jgi:hypothetical protein
MTKSPSNDEAFARVVNVLKESFGPGVDFELTRESDNVFKVKASSDRDSAITDGLETMKAARLRSAIDGEPAVKMISGDDAIDYRSRAAATSDPILRAGYEALAQDALGQ